MRQAFRIDPFLIPSISFVVQTGGKAPNGCVMVTPCPLVSMRRIH